MSPLSSSIASVLKRIRPGLQRRQWPNWMRKTLLSLVIVFGLFGLVTYFFAPGLVKSLAEQAIQKEIGRKLTLGEIRVNPYTLNATVRDIRLFEADGTSVALQIDALEANASLTSLFRRAAVLDALRVTHPVIHITRTAPQRFSFSDIVEKILAKPKDDDPVHFSLNNIEVENGEIDFDDRVTAQRHRLDTIKLALPFISDLPYATDIFVQPAFAARLDGSPIELTAKSKPFVDSLDSSLELEVTNLDLPDYMGFSPVPLNFKLASGKLTANLALSFRHTQKTELALSGQVSLSNLLLTDQADQQLLAFQTLTTVLDRVDLIQQSAGIQRIQLDAPDLNLTRDKNGVLNWQKVFAPALAPAPSRTTSAASPRPSTVPSASAIPKIDIAQIIVSRGNVQWNDQALAKPFQTQVKAIQLNVNGLSTHRAVPAQIRLALQTANEEQLEQQGTLLLSGKSATGQFKLQQIKPGQYGPYIVPFLLARIEDGSVDLSGRYAADWVNSAAPQLKLDELALNVSKLRLRMPDDKEALLAGEQFILSGGQFDLATNKLTIDSVKIVAPSIDVKRAQDGKINLLTMLPGSSQTSSSAAATTPATPATPTQTPLNLLIKALQVERGSVRFNDAAAATPVSLRADNLDLNLQNISTAKGAAIPFDLKTGFNRKGQLNLQGNAVLEPLTVTASIDAKKLAVASLQAYAADRLNVNITDADLSLRGNGRFGMNSPDALTANFKGTADINNVVALDRVNGEEFLRFKSLKLGQIDIQVPAQQAPVALKLADIALSDFYARVIVNSNGTVNLQEVVSTPGEPEAGQKSITTARSSDQPITPAASSTGSATTAPQGNAPRPVIRLGQITLVNGRVNFTDNLIRPNYSANLTELGGSISGMASDQPAPADVNIRGSVDGDGALTINGKINPLGTQLYAVLDGSASDIELTKLTPYAIKYAGYGIEKGKLSMKVQYKIENGRLDAQNRLYLDQLTFGARVDSPTATSLPVLLAVALLKDSNGVIDVNLPVSGSLSDPEFSLGGVIVRVIVNLLTKALISPFSLLASAFGSEEELGYIEFKPGSALVSGADQGKIEKLAKALADRPALKLDITGRADPDTDREGARHERLAEKIRKQKIKELPRSDESVDANTIKVDASEYPKYLERVYSDEKFSKPRNVIGLAKTLPVEEMEKLILANTSISDDDLRSLASQRAGNVRQRIEKVEPKLGERIFLVAPKLNVEGIKDKGKPNRVDFSLD